MEVDGNIYRLEEAPELNKNVRHNVNLVIDRIVPSESDVPEFIPIPRTGFERR